MRDMKDEFVILNRYNEDDKDLIEFAMQGEKDVIMNMFLLTMQKNIHFAHLILEVSKIYKKENLPNLN